MNNSEIYKNKTFKEFNNNRYVYNGCCKKVNYGDIKKKVESIIYDNNFIYSKLVHIVIDKKVMLKRIIGLYGNNIVTIDNEYIPINDIDDIYV